MDNLVLQNCFFGDFFFENYQMHIDINILLDNQTNSSHVG